MIDEWKKGAKYWTKAWNPVIGCRKISEGCQNCYAEAITKRFKSLRNGNEDFSPHLVDKTRNSPRDGIVFVGNMTDIFGDWNTNEQVCSWINRLNPAAINLILTKRAPRLFHLSHNILQYNRFYGITAENQSCLDERYYALVNFRRKWLSLEPLLGEIKLDDAFLQFKPDWIVVGAESGTNKRPCKIEWIESIVEQCRKAGVKVFVKQLDINGKLVNDINKFPEHLQIRQVPWHENNKIDKTME